MQQLMLLSGLEREHSNACARVPRCRSPRNNDSNNDNDNSTLDNEIKTLLASNPLKSES